MRASQDSCHVPATLTGLFSPAAAKPDASIKSGRQKHSHRSLVVIVVTGFALTDFVVIDFSSIVRENPAKAERLSLAGSAGAIYLPPFFGEKLKASNRSSIAGLLVGTYTLPALVFGLG